LIHNVADSPRVANVVSIQELHENIKWITVGVQYIITDTEFGALVEGFERHLTDGTREVPAVASIQLSGSHSARLETLKRKVHLLRGKTTKQVQISLGEYAKTKETKYLGEAREAVVKSQAKTIRMVANNHLGSRYGEFNQGSRV